MVEHLRAGSPQRWLAEHHYCMTGSEQSRTRRLLLRPLVAADVSAVHEYTGDPEVAKHVIWGPLTKPQTRAHVQNAAQFLAARWHRGVVWAETGRVIGEVMVWQTELPRVAGLRFAIVRDMWSLGVATEAGREAMLRAFALWNCSVVEATCRPENVGAVRALTKIGMTHVDDLVNDVVIDGKYRDSMRFAATI